MNLVLVARSADKLHAMAQALCEQHGIRADVVPADLCGEGAAQEVYQRTQALGVPVDLLVNNAGFGTSGCFDTLTLEREHEEIMLNVTALVDLTHAYVPEMAKRKAGGVINVASIAAFQPLPYQAVYGASKAFVLSFSLALWAEDGEEAGGSGGIVAVASTSGVSEGWRACASPVSGSYSDQFLHDPWC